MPKKQILDDHPKLGNVQIGVDEYTTASSTGMSVPWLRKDRQTKRILPFYKIGRSIRYDLDRVRQALIALEEGGPKNKSRTKTKVQS